VQDGLPELEHDGLAAARHAVCRLEQPPAAGKYARFNVGPEGGCKRLEVAAMSR